LRRCGAFFGRQLQAKPETLKYKNQNNKKITQLKKRTHTTLTHTQTKKKKETKKTKHAIKKIK